MEQMQMSKAVEIVYENHPKTALKKILVLSVVVALTVWSFMAISFQDINQQGVKVVLNVVKSFIWPDSAPNDTFADVFRNLFNYIISFGQDVASPLLDKYLFSLEKYAIPYLMYETIMIAFIGTTLGAIISIPIAFLSSQNITGRYGSFIGSLIITFIRTIPIFIWGIVFIRVQGGAMAGVLAIAVSSIGMISKLYIEVIEDIDTGILEALDSTGATTLQKIRFGIIPQLTASFLSTAIYRFEINVKNATILGMVGAGGIGFTLLDAMGSFNFGIVALCLWAIIPVVFLIEYISTRLRSKLASGE